MPVKHVKSLQDQTDIWCGDSDLRGKKKKLSDIPSFEYMKEMVLTLAEVN